MSGLVNLSMANLSLDAHLRVALLTMATKRPGHLELAVNSSECPSENPMHRPRYDPFTQPVQHLWDLYGLGDKLIKGSGAEEVAKELAEQHGCSTAFVKKAAQFVRAYDADDFDELLALQTPYTDVLGTGHLFVLMRISDRAARRELQKRVVRERWSVQKLEQFLKNEGSQKYAANTKRGRKRKSPTTIKEALANLSKRSIAWLAAAEDLKALLHKKGFSRASQSPKKNCLSALAKGIAAVTSLVALANSLWEMMGDDPDSDSD